MFKLPVNRLLWLVLHRDVLVTTMAFMTVHNTNRPFQIPPYPVSGLSWLSSAGLFFKPFEAFLICRLVNNAAVFQSENFAVEWHRGGGGS